LQNIITSSTENEHPKNSLRNILHSKNQTILIEPSPNQKIHAPTMNTNDQIQTNELNDLFSPHITFESAVLSCDKEIPSQKENTANIKSKQRMKF
jgi:hypothetical protein